MGHNKSKINKEEDSIEMSFDKTLTNLTENFNNADNKLDFLHKNMPSNLQNTIYEPSIELDLIQKRLIDLEFKSKTELLPYISSNLIGDRGVLSNNTIDYGKK